MIVYYSTSNAKNTAFDKSRLQHVLRETALDNLLIGGNVNLSRAFDAGCFAHRARQASIPRMSPWPNLAKYNVARWLETTQTTRSLSGQKRNQPHICGADFFLGSGNVLLSRAVSSQVPSALKGLTSVFGMGTGGTLSPLSPEFCQGLVQSTFFLASASSVYNRSFHLGELPHNLRSSSIRAYPENRTSRFPSPCEKPISYFNFPFGLT